jgi:hypothetical protein
MLRWAAAHLLQTSDQVLSPAQAPACPAFAWDSHDRPAMAHVVPQVYVVQITSGPAIAPAPSLGELFWTGSQHGMIDE